jgi:hypothetical protein
VKRLAAKQPGAGVPAVLHGNPEAIVLFNNLAIIPASDLSVPRTDDDEQGDAGARDRQAMREQAPAGWKGDDTREEQVLNALFPIWTRDRDATQASSRSSRTSRATDDRDDPARRHFDCGDAQGRQERPPVRASARRPRDAGGPPATRLEVARAYAISKLGWIRSSRKAAWSGAGTPRQFVERESHYLWGRRYLLTVVDQDASRRDARPRRITLTVRPGSDAAKRAR